MIDFYRYTSNFECCVVEYEDWFDNPAANIEKLRKFLALLLSDLIDPTARHDDLKHHEANQPLVRSLYKLAGRAGQDGEARDQIAYIVSQFVGFQQLQRPFQQAFEEVAKVAAKLPEVEQEAVALQVQISERDTGLASAQLRADIAETRLADTLAEIEGQRAQIADLAGERDTHAEVERELNTLKTTLAEREAALNRAEEEREAAALTLEAELGTLREQVARAERDTKQRVNAIQVLEREVRGLRTRLAQAEDEAAKRREAVAMLEVESGEAKIPH
jgi:chromosome segregation ATPase